MEQHATIEASRRRSGRTGVPCKGIVLLFTLLLITLDSATAGDWPQYRGDGSRSGYTSEELAEKLTLDWVRPGRHQPHRAWVGRLLSPSRMTFDWCYAPVVAGGKVFFGSSADHKVYALDAATGAEIWSFFTDGPVRLAPAYTNGRVFVVSDDGHLYCLRAQDGKLQWKLRPGPQKELMVGNGRMVSRWAARGGPAIRDGVVYFAAGLWPTEGVYLYALDAATGKTIWCNDGSGALEIEHPHMGSIAFGSVASQGYLAVSADQVYVSTGRATPAVFDRKSGGLLHFMLSRYGGKTPWGVGGGDAVVAGDVYFNGGYVFDAETGLRYSEVVKDDRWRPFHVNGQAYHGEFLDGPRRDLVLTPSGIILFHGDTLQAGSLMKTTHEDRREAQVLKYGPELEHTGQVDSKYHKELIDDAPAVRIRWSMKTGIEPFAMIVAGKTAYLGGQGKIVACDLASRKAAWSAGVDGGVRALAAASGRLYAATDTGAIYCFAEEGRGRKVALRPLKSPYADDSPASRRAAEILKRTGVSKGYCLTTEAGDGELAYHLARLSDMYVVAIGTDAGQVKVARHKLDAAGVYGVRVVVLAGPVESIGLPPYFANLVVCDAGLKSSTGLMKHVVPFRGKLCTLDGESFDIVTRPALEGSGSWTHALGDSGNSLCSDDARVSGPLGILWYEDEDLLTIDRHGKNPAPLFADGVMVRVGLGTIKAVDAYNGTLLWRREVPGLLRDYQGGSGVGAVAIGGMCCIEDGTVYVRHGSGCMALDLQTGQKTATYDAPEWADGKDGTWAYLAVDQGVLVGTLANETHVVKSQHGSGNERTQIPMDRHFTESKMLFAVDVDTHEILWKYEATDSIRNNSVAVGNGRVYFIDRPVAQIDRILRVNVHTLRAAGKVLPEHSPGDLICKDAESGEELWRDEGVLGTTLALSKKHDLLVMCYNRVGRTIPSDAEYDDAGCYRAATGEQVWKIEGMGNRPILNDEIIYSYPGAFDLLTGTERPLARGAVVDEKEQPWSVRGKGIGCGTPLGSRHMLFVRSGAIGYYDIEYDLGWMETFGSIRSGCWLNTLPVGGIVLVPDDTRACRCSFPNQASIAMYQRGTRAPEIRPANNQKNWQYTQKLSRSEIDFTGSLRVEIVPATDERCEIRYTLDGSVPTLRSAVYSEPVLLSGTTRVSAAVFRGGRRQSLRMNVLFVKDEKEI